MKNSSDKISDKEVQLYLMGELQGSKADLVRGIDLTSIDLISSEQDKLIKEQIDRLRKVDSLLLNAANNSYKMPSELEQQISSALAMRAIGEKKRRISLFSWLRNKLEEIDLTSLVSGGAIAALGMFVIIEIQPDLLVNPSQLRQNEITFRGVETSNVKCSLGASNKWEVTKDFSFLVQVCDADGVTKTLSKTDFVDVSQKFVIYVLAAKQTSINISYLTGGDGSASSIFEGPLEKGEMFISDIYEFYPPLGEDQITVESSSGTKAMRVFKVQ